MKFGVFDHMDRNGTPLAQQYDDRLTLIEAYDRAGFHAYHVAEHHATPLGMAPSPSVFLSSIAQRTKRLRFGPLVYTLNLYHPLRLLEEICMLDQLSHGRLEIGVGRGISPVETRHYGVDPEKSQEMFQEALAVLMQGFTQPAVNFIGKHYQFTDFPMEMAPLQRPHPPLWYGATSPTSIAWAARNRINVVSNQPLDKVRGITDRYRAEWQEIGGVPDAIPLLGMTRHIVVADTDAEAQAAARRAYPKWLASFTKLARQHGYKLNTTLPESFDDLQRIGMATAGSPDTVRRELQDQVAASGVNYVLGRVAFGDLTLAECLRSVDLLTTEILPRIESA